MTECISNAGCFWQAHQDCINAAHPISLITNSRIHHSTEVQASPWLACAQHSQLQLGTAAHLLVVLFLHLLLLAQQAALSSSSDSTSTHLQQQLDAALTELQHTRGLLDQLMQESSAAIKAACDQRFGALKLLLAEKVQELQECEQQRAAAQQLAEAKVSCTSLCAE